jgi:rubrerythrin
MTSAGERDNVGFAMSIVHSLKKLFDPNQARLEEAERKAKRQQPKRDQSGDGGEYRCRVCGHRAAESAYCPTCLADTMEPVRGP